MKSNNPKGRPIGSHSKFGESFKNCVLRVYQDIGGDQHFAQWARENSTDFYKICARLIPTELTGANGGNITVELKNYHAADHAADTAK